MTTRRTAIKRAVCDAPCPVCGYKDLHCKEYGCGIIVLDCPKCDSQGTGCSIGGAYGNMKTVDKAKKSSQRLNEDPDTRTKIALETIAHALTVFTQYMCGKQEATHADE